MTCCRATRVMFWAIQNAKQPKFSKASPLDPTGEGLQHHPDFPVAQQFFCLLHSSKNWHPKNIAGCDTVFVYKLSGYGFKGYCCHRYIDEKINFLGYLKHTWKKDIIIILTLSEMNHTTKKQNFLNIFGCWKINKTPVINWKILKRVSTKLKYNYCQLCLMEKLYHQFFWGWTCPQ